MDEAYRKKLEQLSRGAVGSDNFDLDQRKNMAPPINNDITREESDLVRKAQLALVDAENKRELPQDAMQKLRPPQLSQEAEMDMLNELSQGEVQPPVSYESQPMRFNKLKSKFQK